MLKKLGKNVSRKKYYAIYKADIIMLASTNNIQHGKKIEQCLQV